MRKAILLPLLFATSLSFAQTRPDYKQVKLEEKGDYQKADSLVLDAATYLLSTPYDKKDPDRLYALSFLIRWMSGTPDYNFTIDEIAGKIMKGNDDMLGLYMAAMTKFVLENPASASDAGEVKLNALRMLVAYCEKPGNNMKMTKELKRFAESEKKG